MVLCVFPMFRLVVVLVGLLGCVAADVVVCGGFVKPTAAISAASDRYASLFVSVPVPLVRRGCGCPLLPPPPSFVPFTLSTRQSFIASTHTDSRSLVVSLSNTM